MPGDTNTQSSVVPYQVLDLALDRQARVRRHIRVHQRKLPGVLFDAAIPQIKSGRGQFDYKATFDLF